MKSLILLATVIYFIYTIVINIQNVYLELENCFQWKSGLLWVSPVQASRHNSASLKDLWVSWLNYLLQNVYSLNLIICLSIIWQTRVTWTKVVLILKASKDSCTCLGLLNCHKQLLLCTCRTLEYSVLQTMQTLYLSGHKLHNPMFSLIFEDG